MALTYYERKARLPYGAVTRVAEELQHPVSSVSRVLAGVIRNRTIETALAKLMRVPETGAHVSVSDAFGPEKRSMRRAKVVA